MMILHGTNNLPDHFFIHQNSIWQSIISVYLHIVLQTNISLTSHDQRLKPSVLMELQKGAEHYQVLNF